MSSLLVRGGLLVTMDSHRRIIEGNLYIEDGLIREVLSQRTVADTVIEATDRLVLPGFVQTRDFFMAKMKILRELLFC